MKALKWLGAAVFLAMAGGCAGNGALVKASSASTATGVFEEVASGAMPRQGTADLRITASLKTHRPGIYSATDPHGTAGYRLLLNIDGQAVFVQGDLRNENRHEVGLPDPEAGNGIRYRFSKQIRLKPGTHRIVVALPDDEVAVEREVTLAEGSPNTLMVEPVYGTTSGQRPYQTATSVREGIRTVRLALNGRNI